MVVAPRKASAVILLRDKIRGLEVFLIKRHVASGFWGGFYAFPGGNVEPADYSTELRAFVEGVSEEEAWESLGKVASPHICLAHWVAGIREVFEEVGILFARNGGGTLISFGDRKRRTVFEGYRELLNRGEMTLSELLHKENLRLAANSLAHYSHWITPEASSKRYDTHFFLSHIPEGQIPASDQGETTEGIWLSPVEALRRNAFGNIPLTPPALCTLEGLTPFSSVEDIWEFARGRRMPDPILPIFAELEGQRVILMPDDELYADFGGETNQNCNDLHRSSRLVWDKGKWISSLHLSLGLNRYLLTLSRAT